MVAVTGSGVAVALGVFVAVPNAAVVAVGSELGTATLQARDAKTSVRRVRSMGFIGVFHR